MSEIYGFVGEIGAGKTYFALRKIQQLKSDGKSVLMISWADPIKDLLSQHFGLNKSGFRNEDSKNYLSEISPKNILDIFQRNISDYAMNAGIGRSIQTDQRFLEKYWLVEDRIKNILKGVIHDYENYSKYYRELIQIVGTELGRTIDSDLWIKVTLHKIDLAFSNNIAQAAVIDDIRFENEYDLLLEYSKLQRHEIKITGIQSDTSNRAFRTNMTEEHLKNFSTHASEAFIPTLMSRIPTQNIIQN